MMTEEKFTQRLSLIRRLIEAQHISREEGELLLEYEKVEDNTTSYSNMSWVNKLEDIQMVQNIAQQQMEQAIGIDIARVKYKQLTKQDLAKTLTNALYPSKTQVIQANKQAGIYQWVDKNKP